MNLRINNFSIITPNANEEVNRPEIAAIVESLFGRYLLIKGKLVN